MKVKERPSPNFNARPEGMAIDLLLLHYTDMKTAEGALQRLTDPDAKVSSHYLVDEAGRIHQLVAEENRAWHAGVAYWAGESDINGCSIGIEIANPGHQYGLAPFPDAQIAALEELCLGILGRHPIPPSRVLAHSDVAPGRKKDPGELFPWARLAEAGIGVWFQRKVVAPPQMTEGDISHLLERLESIGYIGAPASEEAARDIVTAFQRHWLPEAIGTADEGRPTPKTVSAASEIVSAMHRANIEYQPANPDAKKRTRGHGEQSS
jgi:N-acetylmuramoyl-L-alanine amidase